ncbi:hypothetical protein [Ferroplasma sp.]|uniref:hypothetical protein n=1 Tax=Ferroplasma sp. TaxID=2591003 RepID=UPI002627ABDA|nr:hypothetical protein [Ferroplasma sp.]
MNIAYVGNFHNFGNSLATATTAMVYLTSELKEVESIDVFCAYPNIEREDSFVPDKVKIKPTFNTKKPLSILNLYRIKWKNYDRVVFNILPTAFGKSSLMNVLGLLAPYILTKFGIRKIRVVYHNSTFTNDVQKLGYNSRIDLFKKFILSRVEMHMFMSVPTYMPLRIYVDKIFSKNNKALVKYIDMRYFEGVPTIYMNDISKNKYIERNENSMKTVLLHGYWGPQKNLEFALKNLSELRKEGIEFHLILSGGLNGNFPAYSGYFNKLVKKYSSTINENLGYVAEKDILKLFLRSDLVVIPYNTSGGHSGVLETSITFHNTVLCIRHPEYEEQSLGFDNIILTDQDHFYKLLRMELKEKNQRNSKTCVNMSEELNYAIDSIRQLLE